MKYSEKLRDPRWQKKRLEVLERDEWMCQNCFDSGSTLHVHHKYYEKNKDPWDYPLSAFLTLCEGCHETEHEERVKMEQSLLLTLRQCGFLSNDLLNIMAGFNYLDVIYTQDVTSSIIGWALSDQKTMKHLGKQYFKAVGEINNG